IDRVIDRADPHDAVPGLEVAPRVPGQRRHAVAEPDAILVKPLCQSQGAGTDLGIGGRVKRAFDRARDDRPLGLVDRGVFDDGMAKERPVLHQPKHGVSPWFLLMASERVAQPTMHNRAGSAASATPRSAWPDAYPKVTGVSRPCNWRIRGMPLTA